MILFYQCEYSKKYEEHHEDIIVAVGGEFEEGKWIPGQSECGRDSKPGGNVRENFIDKKCSIYYHRRKHKFEKKERDKDISCRYHHGQRLNELTKRPVGRWLG